MGKYSNPCQPSSVILNKGGKMLANLMLLILLHCTKKKEILLWCFMYLTENSL